MKYVDLLPFLSFTPFIYLLLLLKVRAIAEICQGVYSLSRIEIASL